MGGTTGQQQLICPNCGYENRPGSQFCGDCGRSLATTVGCRSCGAENPAGQKFCNSCGETLGGRPVPAAGMAGAKSPAAEGPSPTANVEIPDHLSRKIKDEAGRLAGERKLVTVLFADVVGSMDLAESTDPERWREIMDRFFGCLAESVHRFEGTVDKFTGDGIMALFGAPIAHEDHARRACYAALEMERRVGELATELRRTDGISLALRVGINSGEVVVGSIGDDLSMDYTAVGHTVGLAQRMESLAEPGTAYLTEDAAKLAAGYLELRDLGEFEVRGSSEPLRVFELSGEGSARGRLDVAQRRGFSRFVGRANEMKELEAALERAREGDGSVIGIVAEAGIGKSRLCHEFAERCRAHGVAVYEAQCQAHAQNLPLLPVLQMLRSYFGIEEGDSEREAREKIAGRLLLLDPGFEEDLGLIFDFLAVPDPERPAPQMNPEGRRRRLFEMVRRVVQTQGRSDPAVSLVEDLHWADPASDAFLAALVDAVPGTGSLVVTNFRPEYRGEWMARSHYRQMPLSPLGEEAVAELLDELLGSDPSLNGLAELIRERTGGNPFYVEEMVLELAESGALEGERGAYRLVRQIDDLAVPSSVQAILAARIDRLSPPAKQVLQAAATIGREFGRELLLMAVEMDGEALDEALRELVAGDFINEVSLYPEPEYSFRHPLTVEVAYGSQLVAARARMHSAIARGLEELAGGQPDERAGLIAQHYDQAGMALEAARWHDRTAHWVRFTDPAAALRHWDRIRELDPDLPDTEEAGVLRTMSRMWHLGIGWRLGMGEQEVRHVWEEGRALAEKTGNKFALAMMHGAAGIALCTTAGRVEEYLQHAEAGVAIGEEVGDPNLRVAAYGFPVYALYCLGRHEEALDYLDRGLELTKDDPKVGAGIAVQNPRAWATGFRALPLNFLGRFEEARRAIAEGIELCRRWDRESLGWVHLFASSLSWQGAEPGGPETVAHGRQAVEIAETLGSAFSRVGSHAWLGAAQLMGGEPGEGLREIDHALELIERHHAAVEFEAITRVLRTDALRALDDINAARQEGELALRLAEEMSVVVAAIPARVVVAAALLAGEDESDTQRAAALLDEAERLSRDTGARPALIRTLRERARLSELRGDGQDRERALNEALEIAREIDARGWIPEIEADLAAAAA